MKTTLFFLLAIPLGLGIGLGVAKLRVASSPSERIVLEKTPTNEEMEADSSSPTPRLVIDRPRYDFGSLDMNESGRHEFLLRNRGNAPLTLTQGGTTCRCTVSKLERSKLMPGESMKVVLEWHPTTDPGPYQQTATFFSNDPQHSRFTLTVAGKITTTLQSRPAEVVLSRISTKETSQTSLTVLSYVDEPLKILEHAFGDKRTAEFFELSITPISSPLLHDFPEAKSGYFLKLTVKPGLPQGAFQQKIVLKTNCRRKPLLEIPIQGKMCQDITLVGPDWDSDLESLYLGTVKSQEGHTRRLWLIVRGPYRKEVQFRLAEKPPAPLKVTLGETVSVNDGQITKTPLIIEIPKGSPQVSHLGRTLERRDKPMDPDVAIVTIETTHPEIPKVRVPIRFAVE